MTIEAHIKETLTLNHWTKEYFAAEITKRQILYEWGIFVDVFVTSECIHLCILCIVTRFLFQDVSIMYLNHVVMP